LVQLQQVVIGMGAPTSAQFIIQAAIILLGMSIRVAPWRLALHLLRRSSISGGVVQPGR
jgi:TRAP-type uncharacterized transport system fused permease subunit